MLTRGVVLGRLALDAAVLAVGISIARTDSLLVGALLCSLAIAPATVTLYNVWVVRRNRRRRGGEHVAG